MSCHEVAIAVCASLHKPPRPTYAITALSIAGRRKLADEPIGDPALEPHRGKARQTARTLYCPRGRRHCLSGSGTDPLSRATTARYRSQRSKPVGREESKEEYPSVQSQLASLAYSVRWVRRKQLHVRPVGHYVPEIVHSAPAWAHCLGTKALGSLTSPREKLLPHIPHLKGFEPVDVRALSCR
ncbi:hypothetical protein KC360_g159 [Hortaea werneckii]|nr:hypothetical protein KC360_g159 [Hortaea werneckii]